MVIRESEADLLINTAISIAIAEIKVATSNDLHFQEVT